jgi:hypothetical protein
MLGSIDTSLEALIKKVGELFAAMGKVEHLNFSGLEAAEKKALQAASQTAAEVDKQKAAEQALAKVDSQLTEARSKAADAEVKLARERRSAAEATAAATNASKQQAAAASVVNISMTRSKELLDKLGVNLESVTSKYVKQKSELAKVQKNLKDLEKGHVSGMQAGKGYGNSVKELTAQESKLKAEIAQTRINMNQLQKAELNEMDSDKQRGVILGQLKEAYRNLRQAQKGSAEGMELLEHIQALDKAVKNSDASIGNFQRNVGNYKSAVEDLNVQLADATDALQGMEAGVQKSLDVQESARAKVGELAEAMERMRDEGNATTAEYDKFVNIMRKMEADGKTTTDRYEKLVVVIGEMESSGKSTTAEYAALQKELAAANKTLETAIADNNRQKEAYENLQQQVADTNAQIALYTKNIAEATEKLDPMKKRLNELKIEAQELHAAMANGTATKDMQERFRAVTKEAATLQDSISDVNKRVTLLASNTAGLKAASEGIKLVVGTFQLWQGAMAALGLETEQFKEVLLKLQGAQAVMNGLTQISATLNKRSALMMSLATLATSKNIVVQKVATGVQLLLNNAVKAFPYIAIAAALVGLVKLLASFSTSASAATRQQKLLNDMQAEGVKTAQDEVKKLTGLTAAAKLYAAGTKERVNAIKSMNEQYGEYLPNLLSENATAEEISAAYEKITAALMKQAAVKAAMGELEKKAQERIALAGKEAEAQRNMTEAIELFEKEKAKAESAGLQSTKESRKAEMKKLEAMAAAGRVRAANAKEEERIAADEAVIMKVAQKNTQELTELKNKEAETSKQQAAATKERLALERKIEDIRVSAIKSEEVRQKKLLEIAKNRAVEDLTTQKEALAKEATNIDENAKKVALIDQQIAATKAKYAKDSVELEKKFAYEAEMSAINTRLTLASVGSREELQARKDLIDTQLKYELSQLPEKHAKRKELEAKAQKEVEDLDKAAVERTRSIALEEANIRLSYAKKGSDSALSLTMERLKLEEEAEVAAADKTGVSVAAIKSKYAEQTAREVSQWALDGMDEASRKQVALAEEQANTELTILANRYAAGEVSAREYEAEKAAIAKKYAEQGLQAQLDALDKVIAAGQLSADQQVEAEQKAADLRRQIADQLADKKLDAEKKVAEKTKELAQEVADFALQLMNQQYEARIASMEAEKEELQAAHDQEIANIEAAGYSKEEEEARKRAAAAHTKAAQDKIDEQVKEEKRKQAIANKAAAMIQAAISTALAILNIWATVPKMDFGVSTGVLTGLAAAIGAVQIAAIAAQPVPKYAKGREGGPAEWAIVGEGGRQEVIVGRDGKASVTPSKPTLTFLGQGDSVIPDINEFVRLTLSNAIPDFVKHPENYQQLGNTTVNVDMKELVNEQRRATEELKEAIKNQNTLQINSTRRGVYSLAKGIGGERKKANNEFNRR